MSYSIKAVNSSKVMGLGTLLGRVPPSADHAVAPHTRYNAPWQSVWEGAWPCGGCGSRLAIVPRRGREGWPLHTAGGARLHRTRRQRGAARGRRVTPLCPGAAGGRQQRGLVHTSHHVGGPHARRRPPLLLPASTHGGGAARWWRPGTPALAAGGTAPVWSRQEAWRSRGPPWP